MADVPRISVVTAVLNGASFLDDAVQSVLRQTCPDWELLIIDDGSTDGTDAIASRHAAADARIKVLQHQGNRNRGRSASRNLGISRASGAYVAFLDADDLFLPFKLEQQAAILDANPGAGLVYGKFLYWHDPGLHDAPPEDYTSPLGIPPGRVYPPPTLLRLMVRNEDTHPGICSLLVRKEVCIAVGGFDEGVELYEDTMFLARVFLRYPAFVSGDCTSVYRMHPQSTSHLAEHKGAFDSSGPNPAELAYLEWLESHLAEVGTRDAALSRWLQHRLDAHRRPGRYAARRAMIDRARRVRRLLS